MMLDVYDWILSPEIREHLRKTYPLSLEEKMQIICGAFRSIEEKEPALRTLLEEAEPGETREKLEKVIRLYGLALEELQKTGPEHLFVLSVVCSKPSKRDPLSVGGIYIYASCAELLEHAGDVRKVPQFYAYKLEWVNGTCAEAMQFGVQQVDGVYCVTQFWPSDKKMEEWGIDEETEYLSLGHSGDGIYRYPLPFMTGDLGPVHINQIRGFPSKF